MIRVAPKPEPENFDERVRQPGRNFLKMCPRPTQREWANHSYWLRVLPKLRDDYGAICAYSCHWIPATAGRSVEHFKAKSRHRRDAYEWGNYRLVFDVLNGCKGDYDDVIDPFLCGDNWFIVKFPSLLVAPNPDLDAALQDRIRTTVTRLHLNDDDKCLKDRYEYIRSYCLGDITFSFLLEHAPFLARELVHQGLRARIKKMMKFPARK